MGINPAKHFFRATFIFGFLYCEFILSCVALSLKEAIFTSEVGVELGNITKTSLSSRSFLECGLLCLESDTCLSFKFEENTQMCYMSDDAISNNMHSWYTFDFDCPAESGYLLHMCEGTRLCLKLNNIRQPQVDAENTCKSDGAHLVLITSYAMRTCVRDIIDHLFGDFWVDGQNIYSNNTMYSSTGKPIPFVKWASSQPNGNMCLRLDAKQEFGFKTTTCVIGLPYICQKD